MNPYLEILREVDGYYECPKNAHGKRLGPLVGYAGRDEHGRQKVGDVYVNFAKAEEHPATLNYFALRMLSQKGFRDVVGQTDVLCAMPMGGISFALLLALLTGKRFAYLEKKVTEAANEHSREVSQLVFGRHEIEPGSRVLIVEDVFNNFSTTGEALSLLRGVGVEVSGLVGFLNRSENVENVYQGYRVLAQVREKIEQYSQDDPVVADDLTSGNVVWKPKHDWKQLKSAATIR